LKIVSVYLADWTLVGSPYAITVWHALRRRNGGPFARGSVCGASIYGNSKIFTDSEFQSIFVSEMYSYESRGQRTEDRGQRTEDRGQRTEDRGQRTEDRGQRTEVGMQWEHMRHFSL
jgi:hypothetical protein